MEHAKSNLYFNSATVELWFRGLIYQPRWLWRGPAAQVLCFAVCMSSHIPSCGCPWLLDKWIYEDKTLLEEDFCIFSRSRGNLKGSVPFHSRNIYIEKPSLFLSKFARQSCGFEDSLELRTEHIVPPLAFQQPLRQPRTGTCDEEVLGLFSSG